MGLEAQRALGRQPGMPAMLPGAIMPHRLPSLSPQGQAAGPGVWSPGGRGKESLSGRPSIKKSPHGSSDEEGSAVTSPPFSPTRPLPPVGPLGINTPLPPIPGEEGSSRLPQIRRPTMDLTNTMPSRREVADPFRLDPLSPIRPAPLSHVGTSPSRLSIGRSPPIPKETQPDK